MAKMIAERRIVPRRPLPSDRGPAIAAPKTAPMGTALTTSPASKLSR
jgi:hypothetical protein